MCFQFDQFIANRNTTCHLHEQPDPPHPSHPNQTLSPSIVPAPEPPHYQHLPLTCSRLTGAAPENDQSDSSKEDYGGLWRIMEDYDKLEELRDQFWNISNAMENIPHPAHSDPAFSANLRATLSTIMSTQLIMVATLQFQSNVLSLMEMNTLL